jgi:hypothetical protein
LKTAKPRILIIFLLPASFLLSLCFALTSAWGADIGKIINLAPGVSVTRDGQRQALDQHSPVYVSDTIHTDASGRARLLFNDDSTVALGPDTSLDLRGFADSGDKPVFNVHLLQGVARLVTGKIVEQNPDGFSVSTPEGTIGIRGTIISLRSDNGVTTVYVENTTREVYANSINVPGGQKITFPGDSVRPEPITPQDRRDLGRDLAFRGGSGVAAAAPEPLSAGGTAEEQLPASLARTEVEKDNLIPPDSPLGEVALATQNLGDALTPPLPPTPAGTAIVQGSLNSVYGWGPATFTFDVDLSSGLISNAGMEGRQNVSGIINIYDVGQGSGTLSGGTAYISGFTGQAISDYSPGPPYAFAIDPANTFMNVTAANVSSVGGPVSGNYKVDATPAGWSNVDSGPFSGARIQ